MKKIAFAALLLFTTLLPCFILSAQELEMIPMDPDVRLGKLENGLTYYIRHNENPKQRADFYLVQNVGAILENDDQDGLAHFLEHMAFNGTKNFPKKGILNYFENIGVRFGNNINAYTSLDETVYNLSDIPTTRSGIIDTALLTLHDWSGFLSLENEEIDAERGVIMEEWRTREGASRRMWKELNKLKFPNSQYAKRDVIGDTAIILNFPYKALRDYYRQWYRPDLQAIIIVGDITVDSVEKKIKTLFSDIPKRKRNAQRPLYTIKNNEEPIIAIVTDPEASMVRISIEYKHEKMTGVLKSSVNGYLVTTINQLISMMLRNRFSEISKQGDAPFINAGARYGELVKSKDAFSMTVIPQEGKELEGFEALLLEAEKIKRYGFTNSELERAKTNLLKWTENTYNEREKQENSDFIYEYTSHFLNSTPIPTVEWEYRSLKTMLPQLSKEMINKIASSYITEKNIIISLSAPQKENLILPGEKELLATLSKVKEADIKAREEEDLNITLMDKTPKAGKIKKQKENKTLGFSEWTLNNGIKVIIKPTSFKKDEILMMVTSEGGLSMIENIEDLPTAMLSTSIVRGNGLGKLSKIDLEKALTGKVAYLSPYIADYNEGFYGSASVADFETLLQLTHLYFTAPRSDDNAFKALKNRMRASLKNKSNNPNRVFADTTLAVMDNYNPRTVFLDIPLLEKIEQQKAIEIYKKRFEQAADFDFIFVGNIDPNNANTKALINKYLGGLKSKKKKEKYIDRGIRDPKGKIIKHFEQEMHTPKASNLIVFSVPLPYTLENRTTMSAIGKILSLRYTESIREEEGGSYGVSVQGTLSDKPVEQARLSISFDTDPKKQEKIIRLIYEEIEKILAEGPRSEDLEKVKKNLLKDLAEDIETNNWWLGTLNFFNEKGLDLANNYKTTIETLTEQKIKSLLKTILDKKNHIEIVMKPTEKKEKQPESK